MKVTIGIFVLIISLKADFIVVNSISSNLHKFPSKNMPSYAAKDKLV